MQTVIETPTFITHAADAGVSTDELSAIVATIAADPEAGELMVGTGGARKVRFAKRGGGKSGGYRVITYFGGRDIPVFLLDVFGKGEKANLTKAERNALSKLLPGIAEAYRRGATVLTKTKTGSR